MSETDELSAYVARLAGELKSLGATLPASFRGDFIRHAIRMGGDAYTEMGQMLLLESLERAKEGITLDEFEIRRALDRVRKRLIRTAKRWREKTRHIEGVDFADPKESPPEKTVIDRESLRLFLSSLSAADLVAVQMVAHNFTMDEIATHLGVTSALFRKRLSRLRERVRERFPDHVPQ
jgi:hypothetical protein